MGGNSEMGSDEDRKKMNDEMVDFAGKRTGAEAPRFAARLRSHVDLQYKRQRAGAARRHYHAKKEYSAPRKKAEGDQKDKTMENTDQIGDDDDRVRRRHGGETRSRSDPYDRCGGRRRRRRRRRSCRRRRKRRRRRRRRRSCGRRRRRRRRRSCSRRRRRRSCRRRRRRRRRRC